MYGVLQERKTSIMLAHNNVSDPETIYMVVVIFMAAPLLVLVSAAVAILNCCVITRVHSGNYPSSHKLKCVMCFFLDGDTYISTY